MESEKGERLRGAGGGGENTNKHKERVDQVQLMR